MITTNEIIAAAEDQTGLMASLEDAVLTGLNRLIDSLNSEAPLNERGWQSIRQTLIDTLSNRIRVDDYLSSHPALLEHPIENPLFVFGLPRTGTTLLINLLNADPTRRSLLRWEALNSVPPARAGTLSTDPRCLEEQARSDLSMKYLPHITAIHYEDADSPTECQYPMSQSFCAQIYEAMYEIPSYRQWFLHEADYLPAFRYHKRLLQLLQAENTGHWTLKNPWHPLFLDSLTSVYPDAQLVMTHRDPVDVVASCCSLIKNVRSMFSDNVDLNYIGESMVDTFEIMIERTLAYKEKHGWDSIYDVQYDDMMADPIVQIKKIYNHFDEPWTTETDSSMKAFLSRNPKGKHGKHEYNLEEYGLTKELIRERFGNYCERFKINQ